MLTSLSLKKPYHKVQNLGVFRLLKLVGGFQNPAFPLLSRQKWSAYMLSYWLLFFGNQEQAGQKYNKWVENLVLIENETGKPQENNTQLPKETSAWAAESKLPITAWHRIPPWHRFPGTLLPKELICLCGSDPPKNPDSEMTASGCSGENPTRRVQSNLNLESRGEILHVILNSSAFS